MHGRVCPVWPVVPVSSEPAAAEADELAEAGGGVVIACGGAVNAGAAA